MDEQQFADIDPASVLIATFPDGQPPVGDIWTERFLGFKIGDNKDGTIRVQTYGPAPNDFSACVFRKAATHATASF